MLPDGEARDLIESRLVRTHTPAGKLELNIDCVPILLNEPLEEIESSLFDLMSSVKAKSIAAIPLGGVLVAQAITRGFHFCDFDITVVDIRRTRRKMRGPHPALREPVVLVDDVCGSGRTLLAASHELRLIGAHVTDAIVMIDRGLVGRELLSNHGIKLHSVHELKEKP